MYYRGEFSPTGWRPGSVVALLLLLCVLVGCTSERYSKTTSHGLLCIIFCVKVDVDHEIDTKETGGEVAPAAPVTDPISLPAAPAPKH